MDIILESYDLKFSNGDLSLDDSIAQEIELLLLYNKGDLRQSPVTGVGISKYINSPYTLQKLTEFKSTLRLQLEFDGFVESDIQMNTFEDLIINAIR
jgi:hypothetical protein